MPKYTKLESYYMSKISSLDMPTFEFAIKHVRIYKDDILVKVAGSKELLQDAVVNAFRNNLESCLKEVHREKSSLVDETPTLESYVFQYESEHETLNIQTIKPQKTIAPKAFLRAYARNVLDLLSEEFK